MNSTTQSSRRRRLLVARAITVQHDIQKTFFQRRGFEVRVAVDGAAALAMARSEAPDAILLSSNMEGVPCDEVCRALKSDPALEKVPLAVWCEWGDEATRQKFDQAGADAFVPRTEGREALLQAVADLLKLPARKSARMTAFFSIMAGGDSREMLGRAYEIGEGGMGLEVARPYGMGEVLKLRFRLPGDRADICATGMVRWVAPRGSEVFGMGIEFVEIGPESQKRLNTYLDRALCAA
jgi:CheY-like chemotaxis protein